MNKDDGDLYFLEKLYIPVSEVRDEILKEAYSQVFAMRLGVIKIFQKLRAQFWWPSMKRSIL